MQGNFIDNLKRAYEMEERMAGVLIDLCEPAMTDSDHTDPKVIKIRKLLLPIQKDTLRHKEIVQGIFEELSKGNSNG
jgi:hypothetical protein